MQTNRDGSYSLSELKKQQSLLCFIRMSIWLGIQLQGSLNQDHCSHISSFHCTATLRGVPCSVQEAQLLLAVQK